MDADGRHFYVASPYGISIFDRSPSGEITQRHREAGCISTYELFIDRCTPEPMAGWQR